MLPNGATFWRTRAIRRFLNYSQLQNGLSGHLAEPLVKAVIRAALDLSYERHGALLVVLDDSKSVQVVVKDHQLQDRVNLPLRQTLAGMSVQDPAHSRIIVSGAKSDGAVIMDSSGTVLDVACLVGDPEPHALAKFGFSNPKRFAGARLSTAA